MNVNYGPRTVLQNSSTIQINELKKNNLGLHLAFLEATYCSPPKKIEEIYRMDGILSLLITKKRSFVKHGSTGSTIPFLLVISQTLPPNFGQFIAPALGALTSTF